ncbi:MAG: hypothetical protein H6Q74_1625 [Firmicutes bacterium]|nr:hypothetical protein [Bacillota bacterium]
MPNFKIFQDDADQARIKIYGSDNQPIAQDSSGNILISTTGSSALSVTGTHHYRHS